MPSYTDYLKIDELLSLGGLPSSRSGVWAPIQFMLKSNTDSGFRRRECFHA